MSEMCIWKEKMRYYVLNMNGALLRQSCFTFALKQTKKAEVQT